MKKWLLILTLVFTFSLAGCGTNDEQEADVKDDIQTEDPGNVEENPEDPVDNETDGLQLTIEELSVYNGQDGQDAYVAINGVIYDVTGVSAWNNGTHNGVSAGQDVSNFINNAPHGQSVLSGLDVVGELID